MRVASLLVLALVFAACGSGRLYSQADVGDGERIYEGMSSDEITRVMGRPDNVSSGMTKKYASEFTEFGDSGRIESSWIEWAWQRPGKIYVAYLHGGIVQKIGMVTPMTAE